MEVDNVSPDMYQFFKVEDFDSDPPCLLVEMNYLLDMFLLETQNEKGQPIVITLREKPEHFQARQEAEAAEASAERVWSGNS
jgi:hypothetical protein